jgi:hypothetical protein
MLYKANFNDDVPSYVKYAIYECLMSFLALLEMFMLRLYVSNHTDLYVLNYLIIYTKSSNTELYTFFVREILCVINYPLKIFCLMYPRLP